MTTPDLANVPNPAGATFVGDWEDSGRYFKGDTWTVCDGHVEVVIDGTQCTDGSEERFILIARDGRECLTELTADQARAIGQALIAASDAVDGAKGEHESIESVHDEIRKHLATVPAVEWTLAQSIAVRNLLRQFAATR